MVKKTACILLILALAMLALSCGNPGQAMGSLESMLSAVPSERSANSILWFSNMEKIKELAGMSPETTADEYLQLLRETNKDEYQRQVDILSGWVPSDFSGESHLERWLEAFGFDAFDTSREVWGESPVGPDAARPAFSVMKGSFDRGRIIEKLDGLGYQRKSYGSVEYYTIRADNQAGDPRSSPEAALAMSFLNRMMVSEQEIIAAPANDIFFSILDARSGKQGSLSDSPAYTGTVESLGDVLGAALVPGPLLRSENVSADWGDLHSYDLAGIGYRVEGQERKMVIALYYAGKSAGDDVAEIKRRLAEYKVSAGGLKTSLLSGLFDIREPEAVDYGSGSVLRIELLYRAGTRSSLWSELVKSRDLGFLVAVPSVSSAGSIPPPNTGAVSIGFYRNQKQLGNR